MFTFLDLYYIAFDNKHIKKEVNVAKYGESEGGVAARVNFNTIEAGRNGGCHNKCFSCQQEEHVRGRPAGWAWRYLQQRGGVWVVPGGWGDEGNGGGQEAGSE